MKSSQKSEKVYPKQKEPVAPTKEESKKTVKLPLSNENGERKSKHQVYVGIGVSTLIAIISVGIFMYKSPEPAPGEGGAGIPPITLQTPDSTKVEKFEYKDSNGKLLYYWTGSIDKAHKPGARGTAIYPSNDKDKRKSYIGEMKNGLRDGENATLTYTNGDIYKGSFYNDKLSNGRLDLTSEGMYYIGTFKNDNPYNGKWYYTNGTLYSTVTNGIEK